MITRKEQREATRRIINAAIEAFSELGFKGASTRNTAGRAGTNHGLATYYFKSKEALWREATDWLFRKLYERLREGFVRLNSAPPRERAREAIRQYVRFVAANPKLTGVVLSEGQGGERAAELAGRGPRHARTPARQTARGDDVRSQDDTPKRQHRLLRRRSRGPSPSVGPCRR